MLKRILSVTLSCALLIPTMMINSSNIQAQETQAETDPFLIGAWFGSPISEFLTDKQFDYMHDANINYIINTSSLDTATLAGNTSISELCTERGMYFNAAVKEVAHGTTHTDASLVKLVDENKNLKNCISYYLYDEPNDSLIPTIANEYNRVKELDSTKYPLVNLLPSYGLLPSMGTNVVMSGSYEDYVSSWVNKVGAENLEYLSYDHYPFRATGNSDTYFNDLEVIRKVAYENGGLKTSCFLQTGTWNGMRLPNENEQRWNMYSVLAYGIKNPNYFCWIAPPYLAAPAGEGMLDHVVDRNGNPTSLYEPAKEINAEVTALGSTLMKVDAMHVYHTANVPKGTTALPNNYFIKPANTGDDVIISLMKCKDGSGYYVMLVNKSMDTDKTMSFNLSSEVGITGIKEVSKTNGNEINCDYSDNVLTADFKAGEGRLFKLVGNVEIPDPIQAPKVNLKSGIYNGAIPVTITSPVPEADIYYTLDGTYPTASKQKYTGPIQIGSDEEDGQCYLRAVAIKNGEISKVTECQYIINNGSKNVALNKEVTFQKTAEGNGGRPVSVINDGVYDMWAYVGTKEGGSNWAQIDFGAEYTINKANICTYHDWNPNRVVVQFSNDPTFAAGVTTVFNSDKENTYGQGAGADEVYADSATGHNFNFNPVNARYMRVWSAGNWGTGSAVFEEIQAYTAPVGTSFNAALNKSVSYLKPMTFNGGGASVVNDGVYSPWSYAGTTDGGTNWAQVDFGSSCNIDKANICIYHDWNPNRVLIQFSNDATFSTGVTTVFNSDKENTYGQGVGTDELYADSETGHDFTFEPVNARYMRVWNTGNWGTGSAVFEEIQAYTVDKTSSGDVLDTASLADWQVTGGGTWSASGCKLIQADNDTNHQNWDRSLTYTKKKYTNFIAEGTFKFNTTDVAAWGFIGFGIRKPNSTNVQSNSDSGIYVSVEPKGRVLVWVPGIGEVGSGEANIPGFDITAPFKMKVAVLDDLISISVNDIPVMTVKSTAFAVSEGYVSIHSGLLPVEVSNIKITEIVPESMEFEQSIDTIHSVNNLNVAFNTEKSAVISSLPKKVDITDTAGKTYSLDIVWACDNYNKDITGSYNFVGTVNNLPSGLLNVYNLSSTVNVKLLAALPTIPQSSYSYTGDQDVSVNVTLNGGSFVSVDGNGIKSTDYSFANGVLTINNAYLKTLANGDYTFSVVTSSGTVQISVKVSGNTVDNSSNTDNSSTNNSNGANPTTGTGSNIVFFVIMAILSVPVTIFTAKRKVKA